MKTNITIDNYEALLLDYIEGNLGSEETMQLKAFVAAHGLDWNELTEELPRLEAPQIEFEDKERLKKKRVMVPLYVKIASAAAAAGLLLTVGLWPEKQLPKMEPITELKPINASQIEQSFHPSVLAPRPSVFIKPQAVVKEKPVVIEKTETPLLAQLEPKEPQSIPTLETSDEPDFDFLAYRMNASLDFAVRNENSNEDYEDDEPNLSLIGRGLLWLTNGRYDSFANLINSGIHKAKQDLSEAATDLALTAYQHVDEYFEQTRERREEKQRE